MMIADGVKSPTYLSFSFSVAVAFDATCLETPRFLVGLAAILVLWATTIALNHLHWEVDVVSVGSQTDGLVSVAAPATFTSSSVGSQTEDLPLPPSRPAPPTQVAINMSRVTDSQVDRILTVLRSSEASVDAKTGVVGELKSSIKHQVVPDEFVYHVFEIVRITLVAPHSSLVVVGFATFENLLKRLTLQHPSYIVAQGPRLLPILLDRFGDTKERHRVLAGKSLTDLWRTCPQEVERSVREPGMSSKNPRIKESSLQWVVQMSQECGLPFKSFVPKMVEALEDADGMVRNVAKASIVELFKNAPSHAHSDLKRQMTQHNVRKSIMSDVLRQLESSQSPVAELSASTRSQPRRETAKPLPNTPQPAELPASFPTGRKSTEPPARDQAPKRVVTAVRIPPARNGESQVKANPPKAPPQAQRSETPKLSSSTRETRKPTPVMSQSRKPSFAKSEGPKPTSTTRNAAKPAPLAREAAMPTPSAREAAKPISATGDAAKPIVVTRDAAKPFPVTRDAAKPTPPSRDASNPPPKVSEALYVNSQRELENLFLEMQPPFEGKESEDNWRQRDKNVLNLRKLLAGNAPADYKAAYVAGVKGVLDGILKVVNSLRTTVCTNGCNFIQDLVRAVGHDLEPITIEIILQSLIKLCAGTKKLSSQEANVTVDTLFAHVTYHKGLLQHLWAASQDKNVKPRAYAVGWVRTIVQTHGHAKSQIEHGGLEYLEKSVKKGLNDADLGVRESMRAVYWIFASVWPDQANSIMASLDTNLRTRLEKDPNNPNSPKQPEQQAKAPASKRPFLSKSVTAAAAPKPSLREAIAAKRREAAAASADNIPARPESALSSFPSVEPVSSFTAAPPGLSSAPMRPMRPRRAETAKPVMVESDKMKPKEDHESLLTVNPLLPSPKASTAEPAVLPLPPSAEALKVEPPVSPLPPSAEASTDDEPAVLPLSPSAEASTIEPAVSPLPSSAEASIVDEPAVPSLPPSAEASIVDEPAMPSLPPTPEALIVDEPAVPSLPPSPEASTLDEPAVPSLPPSPEALIVNEAAVNHFADHPISSEEFKASPLRHPQTASEDLPTTTTIDEMTSSDEEETQSPSKQTNLEDLTIVQPTFFAKDDSSASGSGQDVVSADDQASPSKSLKVYEDPEAQSAKSMASPRPPSRATVLEERTVNEPVNPQTTAESSTTDSDREVKALTIRKRGQQERPEGAQLRRHLVNSGIRQLRATSLDIHALRRLQTVVAKDEDMLSDSSRYEELLMTLLDYLDIPNDDPRIRASTVYVPDMKIQILRTVEILLEKGPRLFSPHIPRSLSTFIAAKSLQDPRHHINETLDRTTNRLCKDTPPEIAMSAVVNAVESFDPSTHAPSMRAAVQVLINLLPLRAERGDLTDEEVVKLGTLAAHLRAIGDTHLRRLVAAMLSVLHNNVEPKQRFWSLPVMGDTNLKSLVTYLAHQER
ncbi:MAG: suppressor of tub2 mutation [Piccolia ochrophora]|nr:MAG: suppressor of tub2 mutation [Piccolia ochrophora]